MLVNIVRNILCLVCRANNGDSRRNSKHVKRGEAGTECCGCFKYICAPASAVFSCCSSRNVPGLQHIQQPEGNVSFYNVTARNVKVSSVLQDLSDKSVWMSSWTYEGSKQLVLWRKNSVFPSPSPWLKAAFCSPLCLKI